MVGSAVCHTSFYSRHHADRIAADPDRRARLSALSTIDVALWDIVGKSVNMPLGRLFGGMRDRVDTYASSGLWLSDSIEDLVTEANTFVEAGFTAMKIRIGSPNADSDVDRVRAIRDAVGPDIDLYVDANQGLTVKQAIRLGRRLEEFDLMWFEEPVLYDDLAGHGDVRRALDTPVASGETSYTRFGMQAILDARAVDVLMPDLQRIGGFSEMRRACALASTHNVGLSPHFFTDRAPASHFDRERGAGGLPISPETSGEHPWLVTEITHLRNRVGP